jgi:hypothetical protein
MTGGSTLLVSDDLRDRRSLQPDLPAMATRC